VARDRVLSGLIFLLFMVAASLAVAVLCWTLGRTKVPFPFVIVHICAALCLMWTFVDYVLWRRQPSFVAAPPARIPMAVLEMGAIAAGLVTVILLVYACVTELVFRTLLWHYEATLQIRVWRGLSSAWARSPPRWSWPGTEQESGDLDRPVVAHGSRGLVGGASGAGRHNGRAGYSLASHWVGLVTFCVSLVPAAFVLGTGWPVADADFAPRRRPWICWRRMTTGRVSGTASESSPW